MDQGEPIVMLSHDDPCFHQKTDTTLTNGPWEIFGPQKREN